MADRCQTPDLTDVQIKGIPDDMAFPPTKEGRASKDRYVFKHKTRLYFNVHKSEHNFKNTVSDLKRSVIALLREFHSVLTEDSFVEAIFDGGDIVDRQYPFGSDTSCIVQPKMLDRLKTRLLLKLYQSPGHLLRKIACVSNKEGELCVDIESAVQLNDRYMADFYDRRYSNKAEFELANNFLSALFNMLSAVKHLFLSKLNATLEMKNGISIDSTCDIAEMDYHSNRDGNGFEKGLCKIIDDMTEDYEVFWDLRVDRII